MPGFHLKTVNGLAQTLHSLENSDLVILTYGFSPKHVSHKIGKSDFSHPYLVGPDLIGSPLSPPPYIFNKY